MRTRWIFFLTVFARYGKISLLRGVTLVGGAGNVETVLTREQETLRWQAVERLVDLRIDDPTDISEWVCRNVGVEQRELVSAVTSARRHMTPIEIRFHREAKTRWPHIRFRRYAPAEITVHLYFGPSVWYAPFLCRPKKLIVVIQDRDDFPYRIYGQNRDLYSRYGYTVLDFSEDFSCPIDDSVWEEAMAVVGHTLKRGAHV